MLVTGGTSGVGTALVSAFLEAGALVSTSGRNEERLNALIAHHPGLHAMSADLSEPDAPERVVTAAVTALGGLDIVVNNAAVQEHSAFVPITDDGLIETARHEVSVNLAAPIAITAAALPHLARSGDAAVVMMTSGLAFAPKRSAPVYCATKAGLHTFTKALRYQAEDAGTGLLVCEAILPLVDTPMTQGREGPAKKLTAPDVAAQIVEGLRRDRTELRIGKTRLLIALLRVSRRRAERLLRNS